jgi:hypothetical protein
MRSDRDAFYLAAEVEAFEGDAKVFERRYEKAHPAPLRLAGYSAASAATGSRMVVNSSAAVG